MGLTNGKGNGMKKKSKDEAYIGLATDGQPNSSEVASVPLFSEQTIGASMATYHFDTEDAKEFGVDGAIVLYNLSFWIAKNAANKKNYHEGKYWTYNSTNAFKELFPFWSTQKIGRVLRKLEEQGAIVSGNFNKAGFDKTKWYSVVKTRCLKLNNGLSEIEQPIPDSKPDSKQHISMSDSDESSCSDFQNRTNQSPHPKDVSAQGKKQKGPPPWSDVEKWAVKWAADNSKSKQAVLRQARAAFDAYTRNMKTLGARTWKDSHGNTVKIWKTKIVNNWFKEEQLSPSQGGQKINAVEFM